MAYRDDFREVQKEVYWSAPRILVAVFIFLIAVYALGFFATGGDLAIYRFWAPKQANAERVVFQNTQSFVQGKTEYISQLRLAYESAEGNQKEALRRTIITEASTVDNDKLPQDLQLFIQRLKERP